MNLEQGTRMMHGKFSVDELLDKWEIAWERGSEIPVDHLCKNCPELIPELALAINQLKQTDWIFNNTTLNTSNDNLDEFSWSTSGCLAQHTIESITQEILKSGVCQADQIPKDSSSVSELLETLLENATLTAFQLREIVEGRGRQLDTGSYLLLSRIGSGGMGVVYKAKHKKMQRIVALKKLPERMLTSSTAIQRFQREIVATAKLDHPNIVVAHDAGEATDGQHFLTMQFVEGRTLAELVNLFGPLIPEHAVSYLRQAASGLAYAHDKGVIHRDIKPSNLILSDDGVLKILDMGLARFAAADSADETALTVDGAVMGTVDFMAPEQAEAPEAADSRSDLYSLGATFYFLLTGEPLFAEATTVGRLIAHREKMPPHLDDDNLDSILQRLIAKNPDDRFNNAQELLVALDKLQNPASESDGRSVEAVTEFGSTEAGNASLATNETRESVAQLSTPQSSSSTRWLIGLSCGVLLSGILGWACFGILFKVETPDGTVVLKTGENTPSLTVNVLEDRSLELVDPADGRKIIVTIDKDSQKLSVKKEGFQLLTRSFSLEDAAGRTLTLEFETVKSSNTKSVLTDQDFNPDWIKRFGIVKKRWKPGAPVVGSSLVSAPSRIPGVESWTIETAQCMDKIRDCEFSPDSRFLAVSSADARMRIFQLEDKAWKLHRVFTDGMEHISLSWSPDSRFICTLSRSILGVNVLRIWDTESGESFEISSSDYNPRTPEHWIDWSPSGRYIALSGGTNTEQGILIVDLASNELKGCIPLANNAYLEGFAWSPDSAYVATSTRDNKLRIWDVEQEEMLRTMEIERPGPVAWSPNSSTLAFIANGVFTLDIAEAESRILKQAVGINVHWANEQELVVGGWLGSELWDLKDQRPIEVYPQGGGEGFDTYSIDLSADKQWFVCGGAHGGIQITDRETKEIQIISHISLPKRLDWSGDGKVVTFGERWSWNVTQQVPKSMDHRKEAKLQSGGRTSWIKSDIYASSFNGAELLRFKELETNIELPAIRPKHGALVCFSVSNAKDRVAIVINHTGEIEIWNIENRELERTIDAGVVGDVSEPCWSWDDEYLAISVGGGRDYVWELDSGEEILQDEFKKQHRGSIAWSPNSNELLISRYTQPFRIWNVETREIVKEFESYGAVWDWIAPEEVVGHSATNKRILAINPKTGETRMDQAAPHYGAGYHEKAFSPDGSQLIASDLRNLHFHDWPSGKRFLVLVDVGNDFIAITPSGELLTETEEPDDFVYLVQEVDRQQTFSHADFRNLVRSRQD